MVGGRGVWVGVCARRDCVVCVFVLDVHMVVGIMRGRADCVVVRIVWW
jgi:hypothetical protein